MATIAEMPVIPKREARFFFVLACFMAATIVAGFSLNLALGRSSFDRPLLFHLHAFVFFGFVALYVLQNWLVVRGDVAMHRQLGLAGVVLAPTMTVLAIAMTIVSLRRNGGPFFFDGNAFLVGNILQGLCFGALVAGALMLRRQGDWHKRIMACAMTVLTGPGLGRLLPLPLLIPWAWWAAMGATLVFPLAGAIRDFRVTGRVHPAWLCGAGLIILCFFAGELIAYSRAGYAFTDGVLAGSPGAERPLQAALP